MMHGRASSLIALAVVLLAACGPTAPTSPAAYLTGVELPLPVVDIVAAPDEMLQTAVLAGGCFWSVEAVFEQLKGVKEVTSGYSGGTEESAKYEVVTTGTTGHAEVVEVRFDPHQITYGRILQVFFSVAHDPTQVGQQGPDVGPHYRSQIFYANEKQREVARAYIGQLTAARAFTLPIATEVGPLAAFYPAEPNHQDYLSLNLSEPYIVMFGLPKLAKLRNLFGDLYVSPSWERPN